MALTAIHSAVVYTFFVVVPIVCGFSIRFLFCFVVLCVVSSFTIISLGIREGDKRAGCFTFVVFLLHFLVVLTNFLYLLPNLIFLTFPEIYYKYRPLLPTYGIGIKDRPFEQTFLFHCLFWIFMGHNRGIASCKL